jgi:hypothetical protein
VPAVELSRAECILSRWVVASLRRVFCRGHADFLLLRIVAPGTFWRSPLLVALGRRTGSYKARGLLAHRSRMGRHSPLAMANGSRECLSDYPPKARPCPSEFRVSHNLRRVCRRGDVYLL